MELKPNTRLTLSVAAIGVLLLGAEWYPGHLRAFLASVVLFWVILYVAGGGRLPWKIRLRDYLVYVLIALGLVAAAILVALYEAH